MDFIFYNAKKLGRENLNDDSPKSSKSSQFI